MNSSHVYASPIAKQRQIVYSPYTTSAEHMLVSLAVICSCAYTVAIDHYTTISALLLYIAIYIHLRQVPLNFMYCFNAVSIRPAAGCKYFLTIRPALLFCTPNRFISDQGRCPGRLCHVPNVRFRVWYRFWLLYDIKHNCYQI